MNNHHAGNTLITKYPFLWVHHHAHAEALSVYSGVQLSGY